ncbi:MAG TPA: NAD(P)H-hydrate dehydratase [Trueperaceae bacterium]|nr:NAD(P)H-hydrate dehydratase [Trueperaceae bacterium]
MKLYTAAQMREADIRATEAGVSTSLLMEAAGSAVADRLLDLFPTAASVLVLCGKGNNGGDGYVVARRLLAGGPPVKVLELSDQPSTPAAAAARTALVEAGGEPEPLTAASLQEWVDRHCGEAGAAIEAVIVDALLGSGLDRPLREDLAELVTIINSGPCQVLAIDVPTGIDADSPNPPGAHVRADATVQLAGPKIAAYFHPARAAYATGHDLRQRAEFVADIGIPRAVLDELSDVLVLDESLLRAWLPPRPATAHKYDAGTVAVIAGSQRYLGAAELACRGAWRGGAGLVTLVANARLAGAWPETIFAPLDAAEPSHDAAHSGSEYVRELPRWPPPGLEPRHAAACVVGPGLDPGSLWLLEPLLDWSPGPLVFDAAALEPAALMRALAEGPDDVAARIVLTPHAGEAARLLSHGSEPVSAHDIAGDPLAHALRLAETTGATVVLKGPTTVIAKPGGGAAVSSRGHRGMAAGGTGDVLAGLLGALLAAPTGNGEGGSPQHRGGDASGRDAVSPVNLFERACLAVFVHGVAGERAARALGNALIANDLVDELGLTLAGLGWGA